MVRLTIFYQSAAETGGQPGWAWCIQGQPESAYGDHCDSGGLPHKRRAVGVATLARSIRREYRGTPRSAAIVRLTAALRPSPAGDAYEARA